VTVVDGLPLPFAEIVRRYPDPIVWLLALSRSKLDMTASGLQLLVDNHERILRSRSLGPSQLEETPRIARSRGVAQIAPAAPDKLGDADRSDWSRSSLDSASVPAARRFQDISCGSSVGMLFTGYVRDSHTTLRGILRRYSSPSARTWA